VRKFTLINSRGAEYDLNDTSTFGYKPAGLGVSFDNSYIASNANFINTGQGVKQGGFVVNILMGAEGGNPYDLFSKFAAFLNHPPFKLRYILPGGKMFFRDCLLSDVDKTELNQWNLLDQTVKFEFLTPFYNTVKPETPGGGFDTYVYGKCYGVPEGMNFDPGDLIKMYTPATLPIGIDREVTECPKGMYIAEASDTSPYVEVYKKGDYTVRDTAAMPAAAAQTTAAQINTTESTVITWIAPKSGMVSFWHVAGGTAGGSGNETTIRYFINEVLYPAPAVHTNIPQGYCRDIQIVVQAGDKVEIKMKTASAALTLPTRYLYFFEDAGAVATAYPDPFTPTTTATAFINCTAAGTGLMFFTLALGQNDQMEIVLLINGKQIAAKTWATNAYADLKWRVQTGDAVVLTVRRATTNIGGAGNVGGRKIYFSPDIIPYPSNLLKSGTPVIHSQNSVPNVVSQTTAAQITTTENTVLSWTAQKGGMATFWHLTGGASPNTTDIRVFVNGMDISTAYEFTGLLPGYMRSIQIPVKAGDVVEIKMKMSTAAIALPVRYLYFFEGALPFAYPLLITTDTTVRDIFSGTAKETGVMVLAMNLGAHDTMRLWVFVNGSQVAVRDPWQAQTYDEIKWRVKPGDKVLITAQQITTAGSPPNFINRQLWFMPDVPPFVKIPDPAELPTGAASGVTFCQQGRHVVVVHDNAPYITVYKLVDDELIKIPDGTSNVQMDVEAYRATVYMNLPPVIGRYTYDYVYGDFSSVWTGNTFNLHNESLYLGAGSGSPCKITIHGAMDNPSWEIYQGTQRIQNDGYFINIPAGYRLEVSSYPQDQYAVLVAPTGERFNVYQSQDMTKSNFVTIPQGESTLIFSPSDIKARVEYREERLLV